MMSRLFQDPPKIKITLVPENHSQDVKNHQKLKEFTEAKGIIFCTEAETANINYEINQTIYVEMKLGDVVCTLYTIITSMYLDIIKNGGPDSFDVKHLSTIYDWIYQRKFSQVCEVGYEKRYKQPELLKILQTYIESLRDKAPPEVYLDFVDFLRNLILGSDAIPQKDIDILKEENFNPQRLCEDKAFFDDFYGKLQWQVRDQVMLTNLTFLTKFAINSEQYTDICFVLGREHVDSIVEFMYAQNFQAQYKVTVNVKEYDEILNQEVNLSFNP